MYYMCLILHKFRFFYLLAIYRIETQKEIKGILIFEFTAVFDI